MEKNPAVGKERNKSVQRRESGALGVVEQHY